MEGCSVGSLNEGLIYWYEPRKKWFIEVDAGRRADGKSGIVRRVADSKDEAEMVLQLLRCEQRPAPMKPSTQAPKRRKKGTVYRRKDGIWCVQIYRGRDGRGRKIVTTRYAKTEDDARQIARQLTEHMDILGNPTPSRGRWHRMSTDLGQFDNLEQSVHEWLVRNMGSTQTVTEYKTPDGFADIVTEREVVEVKRELTPQAIGKAIAQVLGYAQHLAPRRPVIAGVLDSNPNALTMHMLDIARNCGIDIWSIVACE